ncbi:hypothetical protein GCM10028794_15290 [Silanimonas algicola]
MAEWWTQVSGVVPWWAWLLVSGAALVGFALSWASALAVISAAGANHGVLTPRQRRMARYASMASLASIPLTAAVGLFALLAAAWALFT